MSAAIAALRSGIRLGPKRARGKRGAPPVEYQMMLTATMCLLAFGVVMVFSASSTTSLLGEIGDGTFYLKRTLMFGVIGLLALKLLSGHGLTAIRRMTPVLLAVSLGLLLITLVPGIGTSANGAQRWIVAGPIQIQASEIAKIALILYGAHLIAARPKLTTDLRSMRPYLLVAGAVCGLIVIEPDLGTAMIAAFSVAALLIAAGAKLRHLALLGGVLAAFGLIAVLMEPYRMERLTSFLSPGADASGSGFQSAQAAIAMGSGGLFGTGLGEGVQKAFYLPEAHTDMIAAVIGEEVGLLGISVLVGLYMLFGYAGFRTAQRAKDRYGRLLAAGLTAMIMLQATINLYAVMGMAPLTGVTLPFVSYGNSSLIVTLAAVGLLLNVASGGTAKLATDGRESGRTGARRSRLHLVDGGSSPSKRRAPARRATATRQGRTSSGGRSATRRDSSRRNSRARGARAGGRRRAQ
ncbi:MAG TPA: putative lipid II flippase FtsW [Solirubrobacterales bacterium]|nr:putative lipid II flippase FtsW [Solirubrobacterales bacterium]